MSEFTPYQQKVIKRYYDNIDTVKLQRLSELVTELYLATGKKLEKSWKSAEAAMSQLGVPQSRIDHLMKQKNPELLAHLVKDLQGKVK